MKKLFIILAFVTLGVSVNAQREVSLVSEYSLIIDTLTNTSTIYMTTPNVIKDNYVAAFSITPTNISGSTAGTAWLQESVNGAGFSKWSTTDTFSIVTVTTKVWKLTDTPSKKYRIMLTGTGTQSTSVLGSYVLKPKNH